MKYIKSLICIILVSCMLTGCSFKLASSVNDLVSAISPFGDNANVQTAMDSFAKNGYSLKTPASGEFTTSYCFYDIDEDGQDEAIAFYEPADNLGTINMAILKKSSDEWKVENSIKGIGKEIYKVDFCDINNDGKIEILVCWDSISNSTNHTLSIYSLEKTKDELKVSKNDFDQTINEYIVVDFNQDKKNELLVFEVNSGSYSSARAQLFNISSDGYSLSSETKLDSHISTYKNLQIENAENDVRVYADALGSNGESMLTEVIYYSETYKSIVSPFYSYSTGVTKDTSRNILVPSIDMNDDDLIDIPINRKSKDISKELMLLEWRNYLKSTLIHSSYSIYVNDDGYSVLIPDNYINSISAEYNKDANELIVKTKDKKQVVFSIMPILKALYDENAYTDYEIILDDSGFYYLAKCAGSADVKITTDDLKKYIKSTKD